HVQLHPQRGKRPRLGNRLKNLELPQVHVAPPGRTKVMKPFQSLFMIKTDGFHRIILFPLYNRDVYSWRREITWTPSATESSRSHCPRTSGRPSCPASPSPCRGCASAFATRWSSRKSRRTAASPDA